MKKIAIVYFSASGTTQQMASAVASGIEEQGAHPISLRIEGKHLIEGRFVEKAIFQQLACCDAIVFGAPTYMGGPAAQFKAFADASSDSWSQQLWRNKPAAGFTVGGSVSGGQEATLQYFMMLASQHGMLWTGIDLPNGYNDKTINRWGEQLGAIGWTENGELEKRDWLTGQYLGQRIASITAGIP
ncbi:flavodoxin family protein [Parasalinivibrio latis]|uniref:flavodoxin family protein n=1 Tax=Parasalinivibrio latis TaxID=2952610 RepID=UPI0030DE8DFB